MYPEIFDVMSLNEPIETDDEALDDHPTMTACPECGSTYISDDDREITCKDCGCVQGTLISFSDRRYYNNDQLEKRATQHPVSIRSWAPLGSQIGRGGKHDRKAMSLKKKQQFALSVEEHEIREVIRIITSVSDSSMLALTKKEIEMLILNYRRKHLGNKIAVGRPRKAVILAYIFLELRMTEMRQYLSYHEFLWGTGIDESNDCADNMDNDMELKRTMRDDFGSAVTHLLREYSYNKDTLPGGYRLSQSPLESIIIHSTVIMNAPSLGRDAVMLGKMLRPYYKGRGIKFSGLAGAIIFVVSLIHGCPMRKRTIANAIPGVNSPATIKNRVSEIPMFLSRFVSNSRKPTFDDKKLIRYNRAVELATIAIEKINQLD